MKRYHNFLESYLCEKVTFGAYHGSNNRNIKEFVVPSGKDKDGMLFFTNDFEYARQQGSAVYTVALSPENILDLHSFDDMDDDVIIEAITDATHRFFTEEFYFNKLKPVLEKNFDKFSKGLLPVEMVFNGMGGMDVIKQLGFDIQIVPNPYDVSRDSEFYLVFKDDIITIEDVE